MFSSICFFLSRKHITRWIIAPESRERKLDFNFSLMFKHLLDNNRRLDFHMIYRNWPAIYTLCIYQNICKLNECIKLISVSFRNGHYLCMHRLVDKRTQWPTLSRQWFCNSEANRHEIWTRLRQYAKIKVLKISPECVKFHSMKLTMMFKLNFEKKNTLVAFRPRCISTWCTHSICIYFGRCIKYI